jgi:hypothetical protein
VPKEVLMTLKGMVRIRTRPTGWRRPRLDQSRGNAPKAIPEMVAKGTIPRTFSICLLQDIAN